MSNVEIISAEKFSNLHKEQHKALTLIDLRTPQEVAEFSIRQYDYITYSDIHTRKFCLCFTQGRAQE